MNNLELLKVHDFGSGELVELKHLESVFGITRRVALQYLKALRIQPLYVKKEIFFSLPTFNKIMYVLSKPGSPGFIFPASKAKGNANLRKKGFLVKVTDKILEEAANPRILAEMIASEGRDSSVLKKLITHPSGKE